MAFAADTILPEIWLSYIYQRLPYWVPIFGSGLVTNLGSVGATNIDRGAIFRVPQWTPFPNNLPQNESDTVPVNYFRMGSEEMEGVRVHRRYGVTASDLSRLLAGSDPLQNVLLEFSQYWEKQLHRYAAGLLNATAESLPVSRRFSIARPNAGAIDNTHRISNSAVSILRQALGSLYQEDTASNWILITHGDVVTDWESRNFITTPTQPIIPNTQQVQRISQLPDGIRVVTSNALGRTADPNNVGVFQYPVYLLQAGFLGFGLNPAITPFEQDRDQDLGVDKIVSRLGFAMHPRGYTWAGGTPANYFPTDAEFFDPLNWQILWDLLNIPFAALTVNV